MLKNISIDNANLTADPLPFSSTGPAGRLEIAGDDPSFVFFSLAFSKRTIYPGNKTETLGRNRF
jgi:hypothetical protein